MVWLLMRTSLRISSEKIFVDNFRPKMIFSKSSGNKGGRIEPKANQSIILRKNKLKLWSVINRCP